MVHFIVLMTCDAQVFTTFMYIYVCKNLVFSDSSAGTGLTFIPAFATIESTLMN